MLFSAVAILKGKPLVGMIVSFMPLVSLVGAVRLASPSSLWARRRYGPGGRKLARARWQRIASLRRRATDAIAGAPEAPAVAVDPIPADREPRRGEFGNGE